MDHGRALEEIIKTLKDGDLLENIVVVGHRVVHGESGDTMIHASWIRSLSREFESVSHLAPLLSIHQALFGGAVITIVIATISVGSMLAFGCYTADKTSPPLAATNPSNIAGMRLMQEKLPNVPNVPVFDTAFHTTIPEKRIHYPLPSEYRKLQMRKYGFHGTSVRFVFAQSPRNTGSQATAFGRKPKIQSNCVSSWKWRQCNSSCRRREQGHVRMGFTPLAGLMMGTRCGSVDPSLVGFACQSLNKTVEEVMSDFNNRSGLMGTVDGRDFDMRSLLSRETTDAQAQLAVDMSC
jgi:acetate kinase